MRFNYPIILNLLGLLLVLNGVFMLLCLPVSALYGDGTALSFLIGGGITLLVGANLWIFTLKYNDKALTRRDGLLIVTSGWLSMSLFGALPYIISGAIPNYTDAFFETISGFTTTGATILDNIESLAPGILFWRSLTQWIGGMGIIVLAVAVLPILGIGGMQLFLAEAPGISPDKLQPRIRETAKRLWIIYLGLTLAEIVLLKLGGMEIFDAINHGFTTMATGGFSIKQASIGHYENPFIHYVIITFMILGGTNFTLTYFALKFNFRPIQKNEEFRFYIALILLFTLAVALTIYSVSGSDLEQSFRYGLFQVVSIMTTTGYTTADYTQWTPILTVIFFILMFAGASAGSTSGGIKIIRHLILFKNSQLELKRLLHPSAVIPVRFNKRAIPRDITFNILAFVMIYFFVFATGSIIMGFISGDFETAIGSAAACLGNVGPALGSVGPSQSYSHLPDVGKWFLCFLMLLGRLELFTVLLLFTTYFWQKQ